MRTTARRQNQVTKWLLRSVAILCGLLLIPLSAEAVATQSAFPPALASMGARTGYSVAATAGAVTAPHRRPPWWFSALVLHPHGRWLLSDEVVLSGEPKWQRPFRKSAAGSRVVLRRPDTLSVVRELPEVSRVLAASPSGDRLLGLDRQGWVALWETTRWRRLKRFTKGYLEHPAGYFSSDGRRVGILDQQERVSFWNAQTGRKIAEVPLARELFGFVDQDKACLLSSGRGWGTTVFLANVASGAITRNLGSDLGRWWQHAPSHDGTLVAGSERDDELLLWATAQRTVRRRVSLPRDREQTVLWSPDDAALIAPGRGGALWSINPTTGAFTRIYARVRDHGPIAATRQAALVAVCDGDRIIMLKRRR